MRIKPISLAKKQLESVLLICAVVACSVVIILPLNAPEVKAQIDHRTGSALAEDLMGPPFDMNPAPGIVEWAPGEDHIITGNYVVEATMTLVIPALNYFNNRATQNEIWFNITGGGFKIDVYGRMFTNSDGMLQTKTAFMGPELGGVWAGIFFHSGSQGNISDVLIDSSSEGIVFESGSKLIPPGISGSRFQNMYGNGLQMDGVVQHTNIVATQFIDSNSQSVGLSVSNGWLNITNSQFSSHASDENCMVISNANVVADQVTFGGNNQPGEMLYIEGDSNGTEMYDCDFLAGVAGDNYVRVNGSSILMDNCSFDTDIGQLSVIATENYAAVPSHVVLINPTGDGIPGFFDDSFDNSTLEATGASSITIKWYLNVYTQDPDSNPIDNSVVTVSAPSEPLSKQTDATGWAEWFLITELIMYSGSVTHYSPFNVSAENFSVLGYLEPEVDMNMSKEVVITVPFSATPNTLPIVSWLPTPSGIQSGDITIEYRLLDPNPEDDGNMSIEVYYSKDNKLWDLATPGTGGDPTENLHNDTLYNFVWDSRTDLGPIYNTTVYIRIVPSDRGGEGSADQTGPFTVDNEPPQIFLPPLVNVLDTTVTITWMADEDAYACVWYGLDGTLTDETTNASSATLQSVTLTGLSPGRNYTFVVNSTDLKGNVVSSYPTTFYFFTKVYIQLYKGWNMISIPPEIQDTDITSVLASIDGDYDSVQWYLPSDIDDPWKHYRVGKSYGNDLTEIDTRIGIWIHMINDAVLMPNLAMPDSGSSTIVPLFDGWNFVGYPSATTTPINTALAGVPYDMVMTYDAITGKWLSWDGASGDLTEMEMSRGYWIHTTAINFWSVPYV